VPPGGGRCRVVAQRPVHLPQHHVRQVRASCPGPGQVQEPARSRSRIWSWS
jgi:hypothetical protein